MNPSTPSQALRLFHDINVGVRKTKKARVVVASPFVFLPLFKKNRSVELGAQDAFWSDGGAYTGEISPRMLKSIGVRYVIVGHSERREHLAETDEMVNKKLKAVLHAGLKAVLCVGEKSRSEENFQHTVRRELVEDLKDVSRKLAQNLIIAYEPIWAIGTGRAVKPQDLFEMATYIRRSIHEIFAGAVTYQTPILYGGSVSGHNARTFLHVDGVDGLLVGGASLSAKEFIRIVSQAA